MTNEEIKAKVEAELIHLSPEAIETLKQLGEPAVICLVGMLREPRMERRQRAALMLGLLGSPLALEPLIDCYLHDKHEWVRREACAALGLLGEVALPFALSLLQSADERKRVDGALMLHDVAHPDAVGPLIEALMHDPHWQVRGEAAIALGRIGGEKALQVLKEASTDLDPLIREHVVVGLGNVGTAEAIEVLRRLAEDEHESVRVEAAIALDGLGAP